MPQGSADPLGSILGGLLGGQAAPGGYGDRGMPQGSADPLGSILGGLLGEQGMPQGGDDLGSILGGLLGGAAEAPQERPGAGSHRKGVHLSSDDNS
jgi:hypothetical protein